MLEFCLRARSSVVEHLPFKQGVERSIRSGLTSLLIKKNPSGVYLYHLTGVRSVLGVN